MPNKKGGATTYTKYKKTPTKKAESLHLQKTNLDLKLMKSNKDKKKKKEPTTKDLLDHRKREKRRLKTSATNSQLSGVLILYSFKMVQN